MPGSSYQENPYYDPYPYPNQQPHFLPMTPMRHGNDHQGMNLPPGHPPVRPDYRPPMYHGQVPPLQRPGYPPMHSGNPPVRPPPPRVRPPPVLPIAADLPHDEMCEVLMDHTADSLQMMFGVAMDPLNFSFMHCMHRTELENIIQISMQLMGMDLDYIAIHYPGMYSSNLTPQMSHSYCNTVNTNDDLLAPTGTSIVKLTDYVTSSL